MKLKYTNFNGKIVLTIKVSSMELFVLKECENWAKKTNSITYFFKKIFWLPTKSDAP